MNEKYFHTHSSSIKSSHMCTVHTLIAYSMISVLPSEYLQPILGAFVNNQTTAYTILVFYITPKFTFKAFDSSSALY